MCVFLTVLCMLVEHLSCAAEDIEMSATQYSIRMCPLLTECAGNYCKLVYGFRFSVLQEAK